MRIKLKKVAIHSLGCKVNSYEAESMEIMLRDEDYRSIDSVLAGR